MKQEFCQVCEVKPAITFLLRLKEPNRFCKECFDNFLGQKAVDQYAKIDEIILEKQDSWKRRLRDLCCRKNAQTGEYEPRWFVRDDTSFYLLEQFISEELSKAREEDKRECHFQKRIEFDKGVISGKQEAEREERERIKKIINNFRIEKQPLCEQNVLLKVIIGHI